MELHELLVADESFFKQKSRIRWIQEGDMNTKFFHRMTAARQKQRSIRALIDARGKKLTNYTEISNEAVSFFQKLLGAVDVNVNSCPTVILEKLLHPISEDAQADLIRSITPIKIKEAMFSINGDKALGPDDYSSHFFKTSLSIVG